MRWVEAKFGICYITKIVEAEQVIVAGTLAILVRTSQFRKRIVIAAWPSVRAVKIRSVNLRWV